MYFFKKKKDIKLELKNKNTSFNTSSVLGRSYTSIASAKEELYKEHIAYNPLDYISTKKQFFGLNLYTKEPFYLPYQDSTHLLYVGATRSAKGVALGHRVIESIRQNTGVIIIDPKRDDFLPQIVNEELQRQNRSDNLVIASYPNNFSYSGFNIDDTYLELANKLTVALDLAPTGDAKSDYYRRNERTLLKQVCKIFINSEELLNVNFELNYKSLLNFINYLMNDLNNSQNYLKEQSKSKPNFDLLEQYSKRYFDTDLFSNIELNFDDVYTLKGLSQTIEELTDANIFTSINIDNALYNGKIIYIQADQLDVASLKMLKILQVDIIQKAKKKMANCIVIADEVSFYITKTLADSLSTIAGFGVKYILAMQDLAQLSDNLIKKPILSNCQTKIMYKSSDIETLEYIEKISGKELVTQMSKNEYSLTMRQTQEDYLNITRLRAIKRDRVSVLIAESLPSPVITQTWHIEVKHKFDWKPYLSTNYKPKITKLSKQYTVKKDIDVQNVPTQTNTIQGIKV
jgi:type IV secretion system protein VirD4